MSDHLQKIKVSGHLEKRRGIYHLALSWNIDGKRYRKSMSTGLKIKGNKTRAETMLQEEKQRIQKELQVQPEHLTSDILFSDFMELWLSTVRKKVKATSFGGYQMNVEKRIAPWFREREILLNKLTAKDINEFYDDCLEDVKAATVIKFHANIVSALKYAVEEDLIQYNILQKIKRPKAERFEAKYLKQSETIKLFEVAKGHKLELGIILGAYYGLRRSEIVGLRWDAINFESNTITIRHTVTTTTMDGKRIEVVADTTKSKSSYRTLPLVPAFRAKLLSIRQEQEQNRKRYGNSYNRAYKDYIYTDALGDRIQPDYISRYFPQYMVKNGFNRIRFHDLRHSCASLLLANGVSLKKIQQWLGHSDFSITANTYAHLDYNDKLESAKAMKWLDDTTLAQDSDCDPENTERSITPDNSTLNMERDNHEPTE